MAKIKWTKETIIDDAKKYSTIKEWRLGSSSAYVVACRMKWNEEESAHMSRQKKKNFFWTDLKLKEEATKYQSTGEWSLSNPASYAAAKRKRLVPPEMKRDLMHGKWTKSNIKSAAETFRTRGEFRSELPSAYSIAASKGWLDELCSHMLDKAPWFGPRLIREYLLSHDIYFISEHKFREDSIVGRLPYDFYLPLHKMVIEYQGRQHKDGWGRDRLNAEDIQRRDKLKREYSERK